jgi:tRNA(fMet)-specific endonuclease VapC
VKYLLDTDTCIYWLNGEPAVKERLLAVGWEQVAISVITQAELYYGAYNSTRVEGNLARIDTLVQYLEVLPLSEIVLKRYGSLKVALRRDGQPLPDFDLLIASTALTTDSLLVTNNARRYERVPGLQQDNWLSED